MNSVNILFVISTIMIPLLLISLNYSTIHDFYTYSLPLNNFVLNDRAIPSDPDRFQRIKQQEDSTCFVTPSNNEYCYEAPRGGEDFKSTHPSGSNGVNGEMHLEPLHNITGYWTMSSMTPISDIAGIITFSDNSEHYPEKTLARWHVTEEFEFTKTVEKYDTFVAFCSDNGKNMEIMQYMGIITIDEIDYVATWHIWASSEKGITCKYPEIIENSFGHNFGI
jgi:hypothetical protein